MHPERNRYLISVDLLVFQVRRNYIGLYNYVIYSAGAYKAHMGRMTLPQVAFYVTELKASPHIDFFHSLITTSPRTRSLTNVSDLQKSL